MGGRGGSELSCVLVARSWLARHGEMWCARRSVRARNGWGGLSHETVLDPIRWGLSVELRVKEDEG